MTISDLIDTLQEFRSDYGDTEVLMWHNDSSGRWAEPEIEVQPRFDAEFDLEDCPAGLIPDGPFVVLS